MDLNGLKEEIKRGLRWLFKLLMVIYKGGSYCLKGIPKVKKDLSTYMALNQKQNFAYQKKYRWFIDNSREEAGAVNAYYWQDLWAAEKVIENKPENHYDIGSRIDGFVAHLQAARIQTNLIDIRPLNNDLPYVSFKKADASRMEGISDESIESISALCSLEHFGLGRYGDPIDPEACFKAFKSIQRVMKKGAHCYLSVPIGKEHVEFNAHRVFYAETIVDAFSQCELVEFKCNSLGKNMIIMDVGDIHRFDNEENNRGGRFGLFEFVKR